MSNNTFLNLLLIFVSTTLVNSSLYAEDYEDIDLDFEFAFHKKSTIEDFPLKEIDQDELSNAAIAGALQTNTYQADGQTGKPIYEEQQENNEKQKTSNINNNEDGLKADDILKFSQNQPALPQFEAPIYHQPNGRIYVDHTTTTVAR